MSPSKSVCVSGRNNIKVGKEFTAALQEPWLTALGSPKRTLQCTDREETLFFFPLCGTDVF